MIDDTCINHEAGDRDTNAEQCHEQHSGVHGVWWIKKKKKQKQKQKSQSQDKKLVTTKEFGIKL